MCHQLKAPYTSTICLSNIVVCHKSNDSYDNVEYCLDKGERRFDNVVVFGNNVERVLTTRKQKYEYDDNDEIRC